MAVNKRVYFAVHAGYIAPEGATFVYANHAIHGLQSVAMTTNFNLEQVFELGQLTIYENIENLPEFEVTLTKVLDGYELMYLLATSTGKISNTLAGRSNPKCNFGLKIFNDAQDAASGTPISEVTGSGMFVSNISYEFPVEGNFTESVTLVGNNKYWRTAGLSVGGFTNDDAPIGSGGVNRRENLLFTAPTGQSTQRTRIPGDIPGAGASGENAVGSDGNFAVHLQRISVNCDLGREELLELGRRGPYHRFVNFPVEVTSEWEIIGTDQGDAVGATEAGVQGNGDNLANRTATIRTSEGTYIDLGTRNKLQSVTYNGGDATGGNVTITYSYSNFNDLTISHPADHNP